MRELQQDLKRLTELSGISGFEEEVRDTIASMVCDSCDRVWADPYGNLLARCGTGEGYKVGVYAHMDEVGMIVSNVFSNGLIAFELMGMIDDHILPGSQVTICGKNGERVTGVIGNKSKHLQTSEDRSRPITFHQMRIDVGAFSKEEVQAMGIDIGCQITFAVPCVFYKNGTVLSKSLDDRVGCLTLIHTLRELQGKLQNTTVYGLFTAQEEVGARGAASVAQGLGLDMFICLDTAPVKNADQIGEGDLDLGLGPVVRISDGMDAFCKGMISHPRIVERMRAVAEEQGLPYQSSVLHSTYLDSCTAQFTDNGLPGGSICFPRRYSHTAVEICRLQDIDKAITLLRETICSLDRDPIRFGKVYKG